jgi:hypothetical protein
MKQFEKQLGRVSKKIDAQTKKLITLKKQQQQIWKERMAEFRKKQGIPEGTRYSEFTEKQKKKFAKYLKKSKLYKQLKKEIVVVKKIISKLDKAAKPIMSKMVNLARKMTTPLGRIASKQIIKNAIKILSVLNLAADVYFILADIVVFIRFYEHLVISPGSLPSPFDKVPEKTSEQDGEHDGTGGDQEAGEKEGQEGGTSKEKTENMSSENSGQKTAGTEEDEFENYIADEARFDKEDGATTDEEKDVEQQGKKGKTSGEQSLDSETQALMLSLADEGQQAIWAQLTNNAEGIPVTENFANEFLALPLGGLKGEALKRYLERMKAINGDKLKTEAEILSTLEKLMDEMDAERIGQQKSERVKKEEQKDNEVKLNNSQHSNTLNEITIIAKKYEKTNEDDNKTNISKNSIGKMLIGDSPLGDTTPVVLQGYVVRGVNFNNITEGQKYKITLYVFYIENKIQKSYKVDKPLSVIATEKTENKAIFSLLQKCSIVISKNHKHYFNAEHIITIYKENF